MMTVEELERIRRKTFDRDLRARALALLCGGEEITAAGYARQPIDGWPSWEDVVFGEAPVDWGFVDGIGLVDEQGTIYRQIRIPFYREIKATDSTTVIPFME